MGMMAIFACFIVFQLWIAAVGALMGCSIYGPISLYGVMAMESAPVHLSGTSHAMAALAANGRSTPDLRPECVIFMSFEGVISMTSSSTLCLLKI